MSTAISNKIAKESFDYYGIDPFDIPEQPECMKDGSEDGSESWINFIISCKEDKTDTSEPFWYCDICYASTKIKMARAGLCGKIKAKYKSKRQSNRKLRRVRKDQA